ncbi:MAG: hypothetical protein EYC69_03660 [Bacteroidetes bacterium]|nr:MAG: hypothetical protein EYC69_03660 [Bacteroidota bacterium]
MKDFEVDEYIDTEFRNELTQITDGTRFLFFKSQEDPSSFDKSSYLREGRIMLDLLFEKVRSYSLSLTRTERIYLIYKLKRVVIVEISSITPDNFETVYIVVFENPSRLIELRKRIIDDWYNCHPDYEDKSLLYEKRLGRLNDITFKRLGAYLEKVGGTAAQRELLDFLRSEWNLLIEELSNITKNNVETDDVAIILGEIGVSENKFWRGLPMAFVIRHFEILTQKMNKKGEHFLTTAQLISFIKRGFLEDLSESKQKIRCSIGEKGLVLKRFYEFYDLASSQFACPYKKEKFIELFDHCFDNWSKSSIEPFFKPNKTKEIW